MINRTVEPMPVPRAQPDSPHRAELELMLSRQTQALGFRCSGMVKQFSWGYLLTAPYIGTAPVASISAVDTWTEFSIGLNGPSASVHRFDVPWRFTESHEYIVGCASLVTDADCLLSLRISTETLLDAVATSNGWPGYRCVPSDPLLMESWRDLDYVYPRTYRAGATTCYLKSPTMPANRRVLVVPEVRLITGAPQIDVGGTVAVMLQHLALMDLVDLEQGGG